MKALFTTLLMCLGLYAQSQTFASLKKKSGNNPMEVDNFKLYARHTSLSTEYNGSYGGFTLNIGLRNDDYGKWGRRFRYENPTLGDFFHGIPKAVKDVKAITNDEEVNTSNKWDDHGHGGGFIGWFQSYWNVVAKDKLLISPGISYGDYIYGSRYDNHTGSYSYYGPYGYFFTAGPACMATYLINKKLWVDGYVNYDISYANARKDERDYPKPHFLTVGADLYTTSKLFGGIRLNSMIDRGEGKDKSTRIDISAGIVF